MCSNPPRELPIFQCVIGVLNLKCFPLGAGVFSGKQIRIGKKAMFLKQCVSGDFNPLHVDAEHARKGIFGERVAHGIFTLSLVSATLSKFPGDVVYLSQNAMFVKPVKVGDTIKAVSRVKEKGEKGGLKLDTNCYNQKGEVVMEGEAQVKIFEPKEQ